MHLSRNHYFILFENCEFLLDIHLKSILLSSFSTFSILVFTKKKVRERMLRLCSKYNARISSFIIVLFPLSFMSLHFCMNQLKFVARAWSVIIILHNEIILLNRIRFRLYSGLVQLSFFFSTLRRKIWFSLSSSYLSQWIAFDL